MTAHVVVVSAFDMFRELTPFPPFGQTHRLSDCDVARFSFMRGGFWTILARSFGVGAVGVAPATLERLLATIITAAFARILLIATMILVIAGQVSVNCRW